MEAVTTFPIAAVTPFTTLDWPGNLAATLFVPGCPWNCPYCHNRETLARTGVREWAVVAEFLEKRRMLLEGVVFSGGEPTLYPSLPEAIRYVRRLGYGVALHTGGPFPGKLQRLLEEEPPDWIGMDYKAPLAVYHLITGDPASSHSVVESLRLLLEWKEEEGGDFEVRTTLAPEVADRRKVLIMARELAGMGIEKWVLQQFRRGTPENGFSLSPCHEEMKDLARLVEFETGLTCSVRSSHY